MKTGKYLLDDEMKTWFKKKILHTLDAENNEFFMKALDEGDSEGIQNWIHHTISELNYYKQELNKVSVRKGIATDTVRIIDIGSKNELRLSINNILKMKSNIGIVYYLKYQGHRFKIVAEIDADGETRMNTRFLKDGHYYEIGSFYCLHDATTWINRTVNDANMVNGGKV